METKEFKPKSFKQNQEEINKRRKEKQKKQKMQDNLTKCCIFGVITLTLFTFLWMDRAYTSNAIKSCMQEHSQEYCKMVAR